MEWYEIIILIIGGAGVGIYGSVAGSSSLLTIPLLLFMGLPVNVAIATNRIGILALETVGATRFAKEGELVKAPFKKILWLGIAAAIGSILGSNIILNMSESVLSIITAISLIAVFVLLLFKNQLGIHQDTSRQPHWSKAIAFTFIFGIYGGMIGGGFGTFMTLLLLVNGMSFTTSAAISRVVGIMMSLTSAIIFIMSGIINYPFAIALSIGLGLGAWIGPGLAIKKGDKYIRGLFLVIVCVAALKLLISAVL